MFRLCGRLSAEVFLCAAHIKFTMKLSDVKLGEEVKIVRIGGGAPRKRLESIGVVAGARVRAEMFAPLNGAIYLRLGQVGVVMRREIARAIEVEREKV